MKTLEKAIRNSRGNVTPADPQNVIKGEMVTRVNGNILLFASKKRVNEVN